MEKYRVCLSPSQCAFIEELLSAKRDKYLYAAACSAQHSRFDYINEHFTKGIELIDSILEEFQLNAVNVP